MLDILGLITALKWQTEEFARQYEVKCDFISDLESATVDDEVAIAVFRIVQECLTNIARHAKARSARVSLNHYENCLVVEINDDGIGFAEESNSSRTRYGILGMKERASALHGDVHIESAHGKGTTVRVTIPVGSGGTISD